MIAFHLGDAARIMLALVLASLLCFYTGLNAARWHVCAQTAVGLL